MKNWWYYYKWYVICGVLFLLAMADILGNSFGWFKKSPDLQIAYIGETRLPDETAEALKQAFASLAEDYNSDGEILVQVNQYAGGDPDSKDLDALSYRQASMLTLMGDIDDCQSYFFLMEDPEDVQREFQVLAQPDGGCPDELDFSTADKVFCWKDCKLLAEMDLGSYTDLVMGQEESGPNQELLSPLYLGRRCFYDERRCDYSDECGRLWNILQGGTD